MKFHPLFAGSLLVLTACGTPGTVSETQQDQVTVRNTLDVARKDALLYLTAGSQVQRKAGEQLTFRANDALIPAQADDLDGDGTTDRYSLLLDFAPGEEKIISVVPLAAGETLPEFPKRTQAELSHKINGEWEGREYMGGDFQNVDYLAVPPEHTDHSWYLRYEGPGWESDLVGYRFYLDWRNATDVFGKKSPDMVLQGVGLDGFDSYHEPSDWGQDVLKVGKALGVGTLATWHEGKALRVETTDSVDCRIVENGAVESLIRTRYHGWQVGDTKTDVTSELSIHGGSRMTRHDVSLSTALPNLATGIVKLDNSERIAGQDGAWSYLATWGAQSLAEDDLGLAVLYRTSDVQEMTEDEFSHVVVLTPSDRKLTYYFLAAWEQEQDPITSQAEFTAYLDGVLQELNAPLQPSR